MAIQIEGPGLAGIRIVNVAPDGRLMVASKSNVRGYFVSRDDQRLFGAVFEDASAAAGDYVAYMLNTDSARNLFIDLMRVTAANAATWKIVTATGTATGGNAVTAVNFNRASGVTPKATMLADNVGGFTAGTPLLTKARSAAASQVDIPFDDTLILGPQNAIAVEYDAGTTGAADVFIRFYYEDIEVE